jgi:hypothetical protein
METKRCPRCGETKPRSEFRRGWCRSCRNAYQRDYQSKHRARWAVGREERRREQEFAPDFTPKF